MNKYWVFWMGLMLILAGCAPVELPATESIQTVTPIPPTEEPTLPPAEPTATLPPPPSETPVPHSQQAVEAARLFFTQPLGLDNEDVQVLQVRAVEWPDACLGIPRQDELCAQVITPGFIIDLHVEAGGGSSDYTLHTNADGSVLRVLPLAVIAARKALSESTGIPVEDIRVLSIERVEWRSSCLGVTRPGVNCLDVMVPGSRIIFQAAGERYEYHTDAIGIRVVLAP